MCTQGKGLNPLAQALELAQAWGGLAQNFPRAQEVNGGAEHSSEQTLEQAQAPALEQA
jgi:hypothetical protein